MNATENAKSLGNPQLTRFESKNLRALRRSKMKPNMNDFFAKVIFLVCRMVKVNENLAF